MMLPKCDWHNYPCRYCVAQSAVCTHEADFELKRGVWICMDCGKPESMIAMYNDDNEEIETHV